MGGLLLVVEDDRSIAETLRMALESEGHIAQVEHDCAGARRFLRDIRPDLIILDWLDDGGCKSIVDIAKSIDPPVPVVLCTARTHPQELAAQIGVTQILAKPFSLEELHELLQEHLSVGPLLELVNHRASAHL